MVARGPASVLVVDDDATFRVTAAWLLRAAGLCVAGEAGSAAEAVSAALRLRPDAILLDVELPDADGLVVAARLSRLPWHPRVLLISSDPDAALPEDVDAAGARGFVPKSELPDAPLRDLLTDEWR
jgi:DNA-binding NarL/FixJ family response regulator